MLTAPKHPPLIRGALAPTPSASRSGWGVSSLSVAGLLWFALWFSINSGPWVLEVTPRTTLDYVHYFRTFGPLVGLAVACLFLLARAAGPRLGGKGLPAVLWPWFFYGVIALLACATSPRPAYAVYWALSYLSAFLVLWCYVQAPTPRERLDRCRHLNYLSWAIAAGLLLAILYISRDALFVRRGGGLSGYGIVNRVGPTAGVGMVRASGVARFAAVPALFAFVLVWRRTGLERILWAGVCVGGAIVVYLMQSRGAVLGLAGGFAFAMLFMGRSSRIVGVVVLLVVAFALVTGSDLGIDKEDVARHLSREGRVVQGDLSSGRVRDWSLALAQISESPLWGWGPQADRYFFRFHVHNTYIYAWLAAGALGVACFLWGLFWSWRLLLRALIDRVADDRGHHTTLIQVGCLLTFFTLRGIPEVSGAMFGIDLLFMLPAMAWLGALEQVRRGEHRA